MSSLKKILDKKVKIEVRIDDPQRKPVFALLKLKDNLSIIRKELEQHTEIKMNATLSFTEKKIIIPNENEKNWILNDAVEKREDYYDILYLVKNSKPDLESLKKRCKLEHGRTITPAGTKIANERAFIMKVEDCEIIESSAGGCKREEIELNFNSIGDKNIRTELSINTDIYDFAKIGLSIGRSKNKNTNSATSSICNFKEFGKVSLKFSLEPTEEFILAIEDAVAYAIKFNDPRKFKEITEKFGRFISKEVTLGGRIYYKESENSKGLSEVKASNISASVGVPGLNIEGNHTTETVMENVNRSKCVYFRFTGGGQPESLEEFDERAWVGSLKDFNNWDCIEFKNPVNVFQLLSYDLRKRIFSSVGKKILYLDSENLKWDENEDYKFFELKEMPSYITDIIDNKDADCNIFATVVVTSGSKNDFFNCQVIWEPNRKPKLMIHRIQKSKKSKNYELKIGFMVIGYDINFDFIHSDSDFDVFEVLKNPINESSHKGFLNDLNYEYDGQVCFGIPVISKWKPSNTPVIGHHFIRDIDNNKISTYTFSYCLNKKNCCVKLPEFTFYTLIVPNHLISNDCNFRKKFSSSELTKTKFIGLFSTKDIYGPVFLRQRFNEVKLKYIENNSCEGGCICKNNKLKKSKNDLEYAFFDPFSDFKDKINMKLIGKN